MDRLIPGSVRLLKQGKRVLHPAVKGGYNACVDLQCLTDYVNSCISNSPSSIPIKCPVRVLHGKKDPIVPYQNSVNFVKKLQSKDVKLQLLDDQGHNIQLIPEVIGMLDDLLSKNPDRQEEDERDEPPRQYQARNSKL
uniref:Serine aminopeptidase S33 domain-containing protein n=1 Tax=Plectus sambesii TaxID=2011161 RepID=A0A914XNB0_9BILA